MGLLGWVVVGLRVGGVWLFGAFLEGLGVFWSLDSVLLVLLGIQIEPSGPRLGPWEPGRMSEDILVGSGWIQGLWVWIRSSIFDSFWDTKSIKNVVKFSHDFW